MKLITIVVVLAIVCTLPLAAQKSGVLTSPHNISSGGCQSCHAPHNGSVATGGSSQATGQILLWARAFTTQTFGTYTSPTLGNTAAEVGTSTPDASHARLYSFLCMSCHDGVTTTGLTWTDTNNQVGNTSTSAGLTNDHPVNMSHNPANDNGLAAVADVTSTAGGLKLYGDTNTVQCASCHDAHNDTNAPFLRKSNASSALCLTCHL